MSTTLDLCCELIRRPSVSPDDQGCQSLLAERLAALGFTIEHMPFGGVSNLWARFGDEAPLVCFAGHTDVVPAGDAARWQSPPFEPDIRDGLLYGRGSADMKGSLAAMVTACEAFLADNPQPRGAIAFLITSDEESVAVDGTRRVVEVLEQRGEKIDYCIVGEPSSSEQLGDIIRNGRRGSLNGTLTVHGTGGHVAYPHLADNPIHRFLAPLAELSQVTWDQGNAHFPPTSFQISNIHAGEGANNVIPGDMRVLFNFRFSTETSADAIRQKTEDIFNRHHGGYTLEWQLSGNPFLTPAGTLTESVLAAVSDHLGVQGALSTGGGTSDARFIAPTGAQVVELGPCNASIHKIDEHVRVDDLDRLATVYRAILERLLP